MTMKMRTIMNSKTTDLLQRLQESVSWVLVASLLVALHVLVYPSYSNAQTGPNGGTIVSEETTVQSIGGGLEVHTTTTVEEVTETQTETVTTTETSTVTTEVVTDTITSPNLLQNPGFESSTGTFDAPNWNRAGNPGTTSIFIGGTCGPGRGNCLQTGNENTGGGTVSQTVDLFDEMTQAQVNRGFNLQYGSHVKPHVSNLTVPVCTAQNLATGPDCRDRFSITVELKNTAGDVLHNFEHVFNDINFVGTDQRGYEKNDFFFTSTVPQNTFDSALATFSLFGEDQGFFGGFNGPFFDNTSLRAIYTEVELITSQITNEITRQNEIQVTRLIETIEQETIQGAQVAPQETSTINVTEVTETVEVVDSLEAQTAPQVFEISVSDNMGGMETSFEVTVSPNTEMTIQPIAVAAPAPAAEATVEEVTTEVEAQVAEVTETETTNDISSNVESSESTEQSDSSSNDSATDEPESQEDTQSTQDQPDEESSETKTAEVEEDSEEQDSGQKAKAKSKTKTKAEIKREIAQKVVQNLVTRLGQTSQDQATQVALMNLISADITANQPKLLDNTQWYQSTTVYNQQSIATNNKAQYFMFGGSDAKMDNLVESQWK